MCINLAIHLLTAHELWIEAPSSFDTEGLFFVCLKVNRLTISSLFGYGPPPWLPFKVTAGGERAEGVMFGGKRKKGEKKKKKRPGTISFLPFSPLAPWEENFACTVSVFLAFPSPPLAPHRRCRRTRSLNESLGLPQWAAGRASLPVPFSRRVCVIASIRDSWGGVTWRFSGSGQVRVPGNCLPSFEVWKLLWSRSGERSGTGVIQLPLTIRKAQECYTWR